MTASLPNPNDPLKIGTRGSPLALAQSQETRDRLMAAHDLPEDAFEIVVIKTTGDQVTDRPLGEIGGKGLFTKEIEEALLAATIHIAVHSMKDMPTVLPPGLTIPCLLERADVRDAFVSLTHASLAEMPRGAVIGTSSLRRRAQLLNRHPDLRVVEFRGNVQTRLRKLADGVAEATFLACAGLHRLGRSDLIRGCHLARRDAARHRPGCHRHRDPQRRHQRPGPASPRSTIAPTEARLAAERAFLAGTGWIVQTPIGGLAEIEGEILRFRGEIIRPDGSERLATERRGEVADAAIMGADAAAELRAKAGPGFFEA